ncbi:hypothetical protein PDE_05140 [Penicillium oxalicum 114-2]|uniref:Uncharacterized protein n=1 Tax=Penicillium oxalicum (strain 114-2 / CGMCC 5302) TaxID=933388 RepID=S7ZHP3_PENO1|nr:hypothetical protein PDE_05140 [Penicillium oxalicum 114-2]
MLDAWHRSHTQRIRPTATDKLQSQLGMIQWGLVELEITCRLDRNLMRSRTFHKDLLLAMMSVESSGGIIGRQKYELCEKRCVSGSHSRLMIQAHVAIRRGSMQIDESEMVQGPRYTYE